MGQEEFEKAGASCQQAGTCLPELHLYQFKIHRTLGEVALSHVNTEEAVRRLQMASDGFKRLEEVRECDDTMYKLAQIYRSQGDLETVASVMEKMRVAMSQALSMRGIEL